MRGEVYLSMVLPYLCQVEIKKYIFIIVCAICVLEYML
jgi:hypothetical protein